MIAIKYVPIKNTKPLGELQDNTMLNTIWVIQRELNDNCYKQTLLEISKICKQYRLFYDKNDGYNLHINGTYKKFKEIFNVTITNYQYNGETFYAPSTNLIIPSQLVNSLINVIGFNIKILTKSNFKQMSYINRNSSFYPQQIKKIYDFPEMSFNDYNQVIGVIELGNVDNNIINNLHNYLQTFGINKMPPINLINNTKTNLETENIYLFTQLFVLSSLALNAKINVYYETNTEYGFYNAINKAIIDKCNIIAISTSSNESDWSIINMETFNILFKYAAMNNITVFSATQSSVDFPSSSPYVTSCGGTTLCKKNILCEYCESAWNNNRQNYTSSVFKKPKYQQNISYDSGLMRILPDVSSVANPATGIIVYSNMVNGYTIIGGTGIVVSIWASLISNVNQYCGYNVGFLNEVLYGQKYNVIKDVIYGTNGKYNAVVGWDPCTGLGSLIGNKLAKYYNTIKPKTNFTGYPVIGYAPLTVSFSDKTKGFHNHWTWDFGNNNTSNLINPSNVYNNVGKYSVTLKTSNIHGSSIKKINNYISVIPKPLKPIAKFTGYPVIGLVPLTVKFQNNSINNPVEIKWDFGDNSYSERYNPTHVYNYSGLYTVKLYVKNVSGCSTLVKENYIKVISDKNNVISACIPCPTCISTCCSDCTATCSSKIVESTCDKIDFKND